MLKKIFDFIISLTGIIVLSPVLLIIFIIVKLDTGGTALYQQTRVGKSNLDFKLLKFRSMKAGSDKSGLLTVGDKDSRITKSGYYLRKFKLDELPQLINILKGEMSFVGPRPEVRKYVDLYDEEQRKVLEVLPGITDVASIKYRNESQLLESADNPEEYYIKFIMPDKIKLNLEYLGKRTFISDIRIIFRTIGAILN